MTSSIFLSLHNLATIGTVAGNSDNFLIFWIALMQWWSGSSTDRPMIILWPLPDHSPTALVIPDHRVRFKHLRICRYTWNIFLTELLRLQESLGGQNWSISLLKHWQVHGYSKWVIAQSALISKAALFFKGHEVCVFSKRTSNNQ